MVPRHRMSALIATMVMASVLAETHPAPMPKDFADPEPRKPPSRKYTDERKAAAQAKRERKRMKRIVNQLRCSR